MDINNDHRILLAAIQSKIYWNCREIQCHWGQMHSQLCLNSTTSGVKTWMLLLESTNCVMIANTES